MPTQNKLISETSPYLLQHADNPVDWYPWGEEALQLAKHENKPILLSIGYSACHWCHVMAHESFEDEATAALMNRLYVNIKVDREERPDLDKIYQLAHQMLTQRGGGWPLTMFLLPDSHMPYFAGTYFPKDQRHGLPSFASLLEQMADVYVHRKDEINKQTVSLENALGNVYQHDQANGVIDASMQLDAIAQLKQQFDTKEGGFGSAPKFPHVSSIERMLRHWYLSKNKNDNDVNKSDMEDKNALHMAVFSLEKMALGGMNDQLGGGFCRYSVDDYWMIPHFEKMLYDNGVLLAEYAQAYALEQLPLFEKTCHETAQWVMREMQSPEGGYYSSYDADSEGEEGKFYVWTPDEIKSLLTADEYAIVAPHFGLDRKANFEGKWHFHVYQSLESLQEKIDTKSSVYDLLASAKEKLYQVREERVKPGRDDKILTSWNGLMIRAMAMTARYLSMPEYAGSATKAVDFIRSTLWKDGRLLATYKDDKAHLMAYLDDYAYLLDGLLELLQVRWRTADIEFAQRIADVMLTHFEDQQDGGFWFVADDHEALLQRPKTYTDEATPSGNAVAAFALQRLGYLLGETRYLDAAQRCLENGAAACKDMPYAHCTLLKAAEEQSHDPQTIIIRGQNNQQNGQAQHWLKLCNEQYAPQRQTYLITDSETLPESLAMKKLEGEITAYLCTGMTCGLPITTEDQLTENL